jgi:Pro-kumamolisin, activation domain/Bacterial Ig-like domain (group 3)
LKVFFTPLMSIALHYRARAAAPLKILASPHVASAACRLPQIAAFAALILCASSLAMAQVNVTPAPRISARIEDTQRTVLPNHHHPLATQSNDIGRVPGEEPMIAMAMHLAPTAKQSADLDKLLAEQMDPTSVNYHRWISAAQFGERFGADSQDVAKISQWLASHGFAVLPATNSRRWIDFNGTAAQAEAAFRTEIHLYQTTDRTFYANASYPSVPSAFAAMVLEIQGLDNYIEQRPPTTSARRKSLNAGDSPTGVQPLLDTGSNYALCAGDAQIIYDSQPLYTLQPAIDGTGQTVATAGNYALVADSFNAFRTFCGQPAQAVNIIAMPGTPNPWTGGSGTEARLDFEWIAALAPGAQVVYVYGSNVLSAFSYVVDNHLAPVVSLSWRAGPGYGNDVAELANAQGITILASSGDYGRADGVAGPSDSPHVTAVGGTSFTGLSKAYWGPNRANNSSALGYIPEAAWSGSGGGPSKVYSKPPWQTGLGVPDDGARDVPDVALQANAFSAAYIVCQASPCLSNAEWVGGTSASAPTFAGIIALINQITDANGQGNINPTLYALAASTPSAFHDITSGSNGFRARVGYDMATGLGSVDVFNLVEAWPVAQQNGESPTLDSIVPYSIAVGSGNFALTVNGKGFPIDAQILWNGSPTGVTMQSGGTWGTQSAAISSTLVANANNALITVSVPGWGVTAPQTFSVDQPASVASLSFSPSSLIFPGQALATSGAPQTIRVTNTGTQAIGIHSIAIAGSANDFTESSSCSSSLAQGSSCSITVTFQPVGVGNRSARIVVADSVMGSPQIVPLSGVGAGGILELNAGQISLVAGTYNWGFSGDAGPATSAQLQGPSQVWVDPAGNLYIADSHNFVVREVDASGVISTIAGAESASSGYAGDRGPATLAQLDHTQGVVTAASGNIYVSTFGGTVRAIDDHGIISTFAGDDTLGFSGDGGPAVNALIGAQDAMSVDNAGNLYLADSSDNRIRQITPTGIITTVAGSGDDGYTGDGGPATDAQLSSPFATAFDAAGNMYISDQNNNVIREVSTTGQISTFAGNGAAGYSGDGGLAVSAEMNRPYGLALDARGDLYFSDNGNCRIRKVDTQGIVTTVAGRGISCETARNSATSGDGLSALDANLNGPRGLALDPEGNLIIGDYNDNVVRKVSFGTATLTFASLVGEAPPAVQTVNMSNLGIAAIHISAFQFPAGYLQTSVGSDCSVSTPIAPGGQCKLGVSFVPAAPGTNTATITINDDAAGSTHFINVTGSLKYKTQITWAKPSPVSYGATIGSVQWNATAVPSGGTFVYSGLPTNPPKVGTYTLWVTYTPPDTADYTIAKATVTLVVDPATPVISWTPAATTYGVGLGSAQLNASSGGVLGIFTYTPAVGALLPAGSQPLSASFTPTNAVDYTPATKTVTLTVNRSPSTVTLTASSSSVYAGKSVTFTAVVQPAAIGVPSGAVQFSDGATTMATQNLESETASWSTTALAVGAHSITATYAGDQNFSGNTASLTERIVAGGITLTPVSTSTTSTVAPGNSAKFSFILSPQSGQFSNPVTLTATGLPSAATVTFSPSSLPAGSAATTVNMTVLTAAASTTYVHTSPLLSPRRPVSLADGFELRIFESFFPLLALLSAGWFVFRRRCSETSRPAVVAAFASIALIALLVGCSSATNSSPPTAPTSQTYAITVTATSGPLQTTANVTLIVGN